MLKSPVVSPKVQENEQGGVMGRQMKSFQQLPSKNPQRNDKQVNGVRSNKHCSTKSVLIKPKQKKLKLSRTQKQIEVSPQSLPSKKNSVTRRRQPNQAREDSRTIPRKSSVSPSIRNLVSRSVTKEQKAKPLQHLSKDKEEKKRKIKKKNEEIRKRNWKNTSKNKESLHKMTWNDQRQFSLSQQDQRAEELRKKARSERLKEEKAKIGLSSHKNIKFKKILSGRRFSPKHVKETNNNVVRYMQLKKQKSRIAKITEKLEELLKENERERALIELDMKCKSRSKKKKSKQKISLRQNELSNINQCSIDSHPLNFSNHSEHQLFHFAAEKIQTWWRRIKGTRVEILSPITLEEEVEHWTEAVSSDEFLGSSEIVEQFRKVLNERHQEIDKMFVSSEQVQENLEQLQSLESVSSKPTYREEVVEVKNSVKIPVLRLDNIHVSDDDDDDSASHIKEISSFESMSKISLDMTSEESIQSSSESFEAYVHFQSGNLLKNFEEVDEPNRFAEESKTHFLHFNEDNIQISQDEFVRTLEEYSSESNEIYFHQKNTQSQDILDRVYNSKEQIVQKQEITHDRDHDRDHSQEYPSNNIHNFNINPEKSQESYSIEDEQTNFILINEIESYLAIIKFVKKEIEVDSSTETLREIFNSLKQDLFKKESDILDIINTPQYVDPLQKLYIVQNTEIGGLIKVPTLDMILSKGQLEGLKHQFNKTKLESKGVYIQMLFDCFNEAFNYIRPYGLEGFPPPWSTQTLKTLGENSLENVFSKAETHLFQWEKIRAGGIYDDNTTRQNSLEELIKDELANQERNWVVYEDEETQVKVDLTDLIVEDLSEEIIFILS